MTVLPGRSGAAGPLRQVHAGHQGFARARLVGKQEPQARLGSITPNTASSWCAKGRRGRVARTAERIRGIARPSTAPTRR